MAVRSFTTNNLVEGHDTYVKFMKKRWDNIKTGGEEPTDILFCSRAGKGSTGGKLTRIEYRDVCLWHCITLTYDIWYELVQSYVMPEKSSIQYKKFVEIPDFVLVSFKTKVENAIKRAKCDITPKMSPHSVKHGLYDPCRFLAMFWTYLDIIKDCKTQRFFPSSDTIIKAAKIFGYEKGDNPFEMNGKFHRNAIRHKKENIKMADTTNCFTIEDLDFSQRTCNLLKRAYINTLDDILKKTYLDLICIRGLGKHEANEIVEKLKEFGYEYKDTESVPQFQLVKTSTEPFDKNKLLIDIIEDRRLTNPLHRASIHTVGDFLSMSDKELLKIRTFGVAKLKKVKEIVNNYVKKTKEESVIDIAEEAAKRVEEEEKLAPNLKVGKTILCDEYEMLTETKKKYDELLKTAREQADRYDELLKQKLDLDAYVPRLKNDIIILKEKNEELKELNSNLNIAANPKNLDTFTLLNTVLEKMRDSKMEYILLTIDGMTIDIHPRSSINFPSNYKAYINKREV